MGRGGELHSGQDKGCCETSKWRSSWQLVFESRAINAGVLRAQMVCEAGGLGGGTPWEWRWLGSTESQSALALRPAGVVTTGTAARLHWPSPNGWFPR